MATWTTIPDSSLEPGKPIRSIDALALRDNPVAIAEGALGAPKIQTAALSRGAYVRQGQGSGMSSSEVYIGWSGAALLAQVDSTPVGTIHTSALGVGEVGTYAFLYMPTTVSSFSVSTGQTTAGSNLRYYGTSIGIIGSAPSGTWRCMGANANTFTTDPNGYLHSATLWLRIA